MVDPRKVTVYDRTTGQLEEFLLFCVAVANKNADRTAASLESLLEYGRDHSSGSPFDIIKALAEKDDLPSLMKGFGFGCYNDKAHYLLSTAKCGLDLRTATVDELEKKIDGVGMKTARYFVLHSRKNARVACLDTHVLKWLDYYTDHDIPSGAPARKRYLELEQIFLKIADAMGVSPAVLDLRIWNKSRGSDEESLAQVT